ncbi:MAG: CHASE2 domain-containing protein [Treponema sp.]|nr:CHASE2 domain-containing protein [Treponema sp.]
MKKKDIIPVSLIVVLTSLFVLLLNYLSIFKNLDFRLYDKLSNLKKNEINHPDIKYLYLDSKALGYSDMDIFDLYADTLLHLKEYQSKAVVFTKPILFSSAYTKNDFTKSLQFNGNVFFPLSINKNDFILSPLEKKYVLERFFIDEERLSDSQNLLEKNSKEIDKYRPYEYGLTVSKNDFMVHTKSSGFSDLFADSDGLIRRVPLIYKNQNDIIPNLAFSIFCDLYNNPKITVKNNKLILHKIKNPESGEVKNLTIPLDNKGNMLINFTTASKTNECQLIDFFKISKAEWIIKDSLKKINEGLRLLDQNNQELPYYFSAKDLLNFSNQIEAYRQELYQRLNGYNTNQNPKEIISEYEYSYYFNLRKQFYSQIDNFVKSKHLSQVLNHINKELKENPKLYSKEEIEELKNNLTNIDSAYIDYKNLNISLNSEYKDSICFIGSKISSQEDYSLTTSRKLQSNSKIQGDIFYTLLSGKFITYINFYWILLASGILFILSYFIRFKKLWLSFLIRALSLLILHGIFILLFVFFDIYTTLSLTFTYFTIIYSLLFAYQILKYWNDKKNILSLVKGKLNSNRYKEIYKNLPKMISVKNDYALCLEVKVENLPSFVKAAKIVYQSKYPQVISDFYQKYINVISKVIFENNGYVEKLRPEAIKVFFTDIEKISSKEEKAYRAFKTALEIIEAENNLIKEYSSLFTSHSVISQDNESLVTIKAPQSRIVITGGDSISSAININDDSYDFSSYLITGPMEFDSSNYYKVNDFYHSSIVSTFDCWQLANAYNSQNPFIGRRLDCIRFGNKNSKQIFYEILGISDSFAHEKREQLDIFNAGMEEYLNQNFMRAGQLFLQSVKINAFEDNLAIILAQRCKNFITNGIPENWDFTININI